MTAAREQTIFDRILDGKIPCHKVYDDDHVLAFLDIAPLSRGHTLIIPRERKAFLHELSDDAAAALGRALPRIARAVLRVTGAKSYNVLQNNGAAAHQAVMHVHFHIIPKPPADADDGADAEDENATNSGAGSGLGLIWKPTKLDSAAAAAIANEIREKLKVDRP